MEGKVYFEIVLHGKNKEGIKQNYGLGLGTYDLKKLIDGDNPQSDDLPIKITKSNETVAEITGLLIDFKPNESMK